MIWSRSSGILFFLASSIIGAQSAENGIAGLETCFQAARIADAICSRLANDPVLRLDCFQKTSSAQLECLEQVLSEAHAAPVPQESLGSQPGPPAAQQSRPKDASIRTVHAGSTTTPDESTRLGEANSLPTATVKTNPTEQPGFPPPAEATAVERFSKGAESRTEGPLVQESHSPSVASPTISLDRSSPTDTTTSQRSQMDASSEQTGATGSTTTPTENRRREKINDAPAASPMTNSIDRPPPATEATASEQPSSGASAVPTDGTGSMTTSTESSRLQEYNRAPAATPETDSSALSSPPRNTVAAERSSAGVSVKPIEGIPPPAVSAEHVLQESNGLSKVTAETEEPTGARSTTNAAAPPGSLADASSKQAGFAPPPAKSADGGLLEQADGPPKSAVATNPGGRPDPFPVTNDIVATGSSREVLQGQLGNSKAPVAPTASGSPQNSNNAPKAKFATAPPQQPMADESTTGAISPGLPVKPTVQSSQPIGSGWVVSETTSPIDYTPLVTALIRSTSQKKDAPNTLIIRCRGQRTELAVRTDGVWRTPRGSETQGAYQINEHPAVGQRWILSPDGKSATYKDDVIGLLQALPDGASLKINLTDQASSTHEATFHLDGWSAVGRKIGTACRWSPIADQRSQRR
jgi:hypothetical protein